MIMSKVTILLLNYHKVVGKFIIKGRLKVNIYTYIYIYPLELEILDKVGSRWQIE